MDPLQLFPSITIFATERGGVISLAYGAGRQPLLFFTTRQAVVIRPRQITLDEYTPRIYKERLSQVILPGSMTSPLYDYQVLTFDTSGTIGDGYLYIDKRRDSNISIPVP